MLNKIKIIGKILVNKEKDERKINDATSVFQEAASGADETQYNSELREGKRLYFSMLVPTLSNAVTPLRCVALGEVAKRIEKELQTGDIVEISGYLRNERVGRQIIIKVVEFNKLDLSFDELINLTTNENKDTNQVRLMGKIITDLQASEDKLKRPKLTFKLAVPREGVRNPVFFCRVNGEQISEVSEKLKKGDIVLLEGFLQTKSETKKLARFGETTFQLDEDYSISDDSEEGQRKEGKKEQGERTSHIICLRFIRIDSDSVNTFSLLDELTRITVPVEKIDFTKPKP